MSYFDNSVEISGKAINTIQDEVENKLEYNNSQAIILYTYLLATHIVLGNINIHQMLKLLNDAVKITLKEINSGNIAVYVEEVDDNEKKKVN